MLLVLAEAAGVGAHRGLDRQHVPAQRLGLRPGAEQVPGLIARKRLRHGCYPSPASGPEPRRSHHGKAPDRGRGAAVRHDRARRQQERGAAAARLQPPHRRGGRAAQRPADPRRRGDAATCSPTSACASSGATRTPSRCRPTRCAAPRSSAALAERIRASFLAAGPLLGALRLSALMPPPGGDVIGRRRLDPHLDAFRALGATVEHGRDIRITAERRADRRATSSWTSRR